MDNPNHANVYDRPKQWKDDMRWEHRDAIKDKLCPYEELQGERHERKEEVVAVKEDGVELESHESLEKAK